MLFHPDTHRLAFAADKPVRKIWHYVTLTVSLLVLGCTGLEVGQDYDVHTDFSGLKAFAWKSSEPSRTGDVRIDNPLIDKRIRAAVERTLKAKGFSKAPGGLSDFFVSYTIQIQRRIESDRVRTGVGFGFGSSGSFGGVGVSSGGGVSEFDESLLVIDISDDGGRNLLWRGTGARRMPRHSNPEQITADIEVTVEKILAQFPPKSK